MQPVAKHDAPARTADRRDGARSGLAPQLWCEARRVVLSPTGTEDGKLSVAAGTSVQRGLATRVDFGSQPGDGGPSLTMPVLAGRAAKVVDSSALSFLTAQALEAEEAAKIKAELDVLMSIPQADCTPEQRQGKLEFYQPGNVLPRTSESRGAQDARFCLGGAVFCAMHGSTVDTVHTPVEAFGSSSHFSS